MAGHHGVPCRRALPRWWKTEPLAVYLTSPEGELLRAGALHFPPFRGVDSFEFKIDLTGFEGGDYRVRVTELADPSAVYGDLPVRL